ncbi:MAG TPA: tetratricopeptide repeat protein [Spirochaetia bacterium]|nr:tetratricopeptide repeat protein [Spirochaetia bacterium]
MTGEKEVQKASTDMKPKELAQDTISTIESLNKQAWDTMLDNPREGLSLSREAFELSKEVKYQKGTAESLLNAGWCHNYLASFDEAFEDLYKALDLFTTIQDNEGVMKAYNALGAVFHNIGKYEDALTYFTKSLQLSIESDNNLRRVAALNNIGEVYDALGRSTEALEYFKEASKIAEEFHDRESLATALLNLGKMYRKLTMYDEALAHIINALKLSKETHDRISEAKCLDSMGLVHEEKGQHNEALSLYEQSLTVCRDTGDRLGEAEVLIHLGNILFRMGSVDKAIATYENALEICTAIHSMSVASRCLKALSEVHESLSHFEEALRYHKDFYKCEKEIFGEEENKKISSLTVYFELEKAKREREIFRLKNIELKQKANELEESYKRISIISQIGQKITASLDIEVIVNTVYGYINLLMDAELSGIALYDKQNEIVNYRFFIFRGERIPGMSINVKEKETIAGWCIKNHHEVLLNDFQTEYIQYQKEIVPIVEEIAHSLMYVPLIIGNDVIGVITVQSYRKSAYSEFHMDILKALASYIAIAVENSNIHNELRSLNRIIASEKEKLENAYQKIFHMANHDALTGLPNRRLLAEFVGKEIAQAQRQRYMFAILYIDLDCFKPINDNYGHEMGDEVLKIIAERFVKALRSSDTVARIGGDEFIVAIHNVKSRESVRTVSKKIIASVGKPITLGQVSCTIGTSIGISIFPLDDDTFEGLVAKADRAMYQVKQTGKNNFKFYKDFSDDAKRQAMQCE